jgi:RimJ/RimL family protein N-acetyltransferase
VGDLLIRRSRADDFAAWFQLFEEVAGEGRWIGTELPVDPERMRRSFERELGSDEGATFLAERDGLLVGQLGVTLGMGLGRGCAELGMMVRDGHRGGGIGSALLSACIDWCREHDAHKVALTVWPHNDRAIALYEKHGFSVEGRLVRHYRRRNGELWDAIAMGLVLDTTSSGG